MKTLLAVVTMTVIACGIMSSQEFCGQTGPMQDPISQQSTFPVIGGIHLPARGQ